MSTPSSGDYSLSVSPHVFTPPSSPSAGPSTSTTTTALPARTSAAALPSLGELKAMLAAGQPLTLEQKQLMRTLLQQERSLTQTTRQGHVSGAATEAAHVATGVAQVRAIDFATEFRTNGLRNMAVFQDGGFRRIREPTSEDELHTVLRDVHRMAYIDRHGVFKAASPEVDSHVAVGSPVTVTDVDGRATTITVTHKHSLMTAEEFEEFKSALSLYLYSLLISRPRQPERQVDNPKTILPNDTPRLDGAPKPAAKSTYLNFMVAGVKTRQITYANRNNNHDREKETAHKQMVHRQVVHDDYSDDVREDHRDDAIRRDDIHTELDTHS